MACTWIPAGRTKWTNTKFPSPLRVPDPKLCSYTTGILQICTAEIHDILYSYNYSLPLSPSPQASVCTRTKPHVSNSTDFDKSKRIYNTETCIFSNKSFCANQKAQNFQNFRFKLNQEGAMSSPTFFNRTLKISQNARQKRISLPCFHAHTKARAFLPPPPLLHMLALKAHHPLSSDLRRIVVTRAKSHVTLLPFPLPPPLCWNGPLLDDPPPPSLSRIYGLCLSTGLLAILRYTAAYYRGKGSGRGEERREEELTRRIERVFKPPYTRGVGRRLARLGGGKSKSERIREVDFRPADVVHPLPLSLLFAFVRKCQLADIKSSLDQRVWDDD